MKGLVDIPALEALQAAYDALYGSEPVSPENLALWSQWARFDPRLAEIIVAFLGARWKSLSLIELRKSLIERPWPAAFGVLAENAIAGRLIPKEERALFQSWIKTLLTGVPPAPNELFFFGTRKIGGREIFRDATASSRTYRRWGYLGRDLLVNKADPARFASRGATLLSRSDRTRLLADFVRAYPRFTVHDYQTALNYRVSRRQAEIDLARFPGIIGIGNTRGRFYRRRRRGDSD